MTYTANWDDWNAKVPMRSKSWIFLLLPFVPFSLPSVLAQESPRKDHTKTVWTSGPAIICNDLHLG